MNWDDLRVFLAVARERSHSAAARRLGVTQPTVGRRIQALERALEVRLFERPGGSLTRVGHAVLAEAEAIEARVFATERAAESDVEELDGQVRVAASDWLVARVLPGAIPTIAAEAPGLRVDLELQSKLVILRRNEADLALRPRRFEDQDVWQRAVGFVAFAVYASPRYLARRGPPSLDSRCEGHDLIAMDDDHGPIADVTWLRRVAANARVCARVNGREAMARLAASELGLACLPTLVGDACDDLVRVDAFTEAPGRTLWLGAHRDHRQLRRVRLVAEAVRSCVAALLPPRRSRARE